MYTMYVHVWFGGSVLCCLIWEGEVGGGGVCRVGGEEGEIGVCGASVLWLALAVWFAVAGVNINYLHP